MPTDHIGFQIRILSNLINRKINQMVAEEEEMLTPHQGLGFELYDPTQGTGHHAA